MCKTQELQEQIEQHRQAIYQLAANAGVVNAVPVEVASHHAEIFVLASQLAEISSRRIVFLTRVVMFLTGVLVALTAVLVFLTFKLIPSH